MKKILVLVFLIVVLVGCTRKLTLEPAKDPLLIALATSQAQQAVALKGIEVQLAQQPTAIPQSTVIITVIETPTPTPEPVLPQNMAPVQGDLAVAIAPVVFVEDISHDAWTIQGTDRLVDNPIVAGWLGRLKDPAPSLWKYFPNLPNPDVPDFRVVKCADNPEKDCVPDGMEYGTYDTPYCWQSPCDIPVGAWEYRYITGDYQFLDQVCKGDMSKGCMLVLINVMDQSYTWRSQYVDNGFTLRGRYFNGDALEWGVWGLVSHGSASMLNMKTYSHPGELMNNGQPGNSGANCGIPGGCKSIDVTVIVHAGDAIIAQAKTIVKPTQ